MFDGIYEYIGKALTACYDLVPNYAIAIALLTLGVMVLTTPFTLKGTRSMIQMQRLQPEMKRLQLKYKDDRQKLNEELMAFYKENQLNPLGGCLPLLLQAPIFFFLFHIVRGITRVGADGTFAPQHIDAGSAMYRALDHSKEMTAFGVNLAESASRALSTGFVNGLPHVIMVLIVAVSSYYQQKQIQGRNPNAEIPAQQKMLMRMMPAMFVFFAFIEPAALVVYFVVSNLYRIGMQAYITRTLYHGEDSLGAQAQRASVEAKALKDEHGSPELLPKLGRKAKAIDVESSSSTPSKGGPAKTTTGASNGNRPTPPSATTRTGAANRSKKKKKRR